MPKPAKPEEALEVLVERKVKELLRARKVDETKLSALSLAIKYLAVKKRHDDGDGWGAELTGPNGGEV